jgi:hypothetical protein
VQSSLFGPRTAGRSDLDPRTLVWAVLDLYISHATNGIKFTQLERTASSERATSEHTTPEEVTAA